MAAVPEVRLEEIGFVEFTAALITNTFDALLTAHLRQTESFAALVSTVGRSLESFVNETKDSVDASEIAGLLAAVGALKESNFDILVGNQPVPAVAVKLDAPERLALANALAIPTIAANDLGATVTLDAGGIADIKAAVARRIAANRFTLVQEIVRQGVLRLVVESGVIESRMNVRAYARASSSSSVRTRSDVRSLAVGAGLVTGLGPIAIGSGSTARTTLAIADTAQRANASSGSNVSVSGRIEIRFKSDFVPLAAT